MRKAKPEKRIILPDPIYNSRLVTKLINSLMLDGKKGLAQTILYGAFNDIKEKTGKDPLEVFNKALENIMPILELKVRRVAGSNFQVPTEVTPARKQTLGLRWLTQYSRLRHEKTMQERLANEIIDASNGIGASVKKKDDTHKMAEANKAFAHLRW
ncbi:MAG: 30S ribosomal protein S7 [Ureaplasma sp.]|nr:30S ribosomal protein S7 [Ureaplasma sp.]MDE7221844.1 30S ribosomal protein S7 [Ureaplasma sp.]